MGASSGTVEGLLVTMDLGLGGTTLGLGGTTAQLTMEHSRLGALAEPVGMMGCGGAEGKRGGNQGASKAI